VKRLSSVAVLALTTALIGGGGCASSRTTSGDRHVVPKSFSDVSLEKFDEVGLLEVDLHTAVQTREAVEREFEKRYGKAGHPRWFFHAFDVTSLDFVVARYEPTKGQPARYVAERRLRVKRSTDAERALGVADVTFSYERSSHGIDVGMSKQDVVKIAGKPLAERSLGRAGSFELRYPSFCVRFVRGKVAHVWRPEQCAR